MKTSQSSVASPVSDREAFFCPNATTLGMMKDVEKSSNPTWILFALALPFLYVFSIGPVVFFSEKSGHDPDLLRKVYSPLIWLHDHTPLEKPLEAYVNFWDRMAR